MPKKEKDASPTRKVQDLPAMPPACQDPEHSPPYMIVLDPGVYEHTCPTCAHVARFVVPNRVGM